MAPRRKILLEKGPGTLPERPPREFPFPGKPETEPRTPPDPFKPPEPGVIPQPKGRGNYLLLLKRKRK